MLCAIVSGIFKLARFYIKVGSYCHNVSCSCHLFTSTFYLQLEEEGRKLYEQLQQSNDDLTAANDKINGQYLLIDLVSYTFSNRHLQSTCYQLTAMSTLSCRL